MGKTKKDLHEQIEEYLLDNGIQRKWFAKKIGMSPSLFYKVLGGFSQFPKKYFQALVSETKGKVSWKDVISDYFTNIPGVEITWNPEENKCEIYLKNKEG
jgi:hypothetical protein